MAKKFVSSENLQSALTGVKAYIDNVKTVVEGQITESASGIEEQLDDYLKKSDILEEGVKAGLAKQSDLTTVSNTVTTLESDVDDLKERMDDAEGDISTNTSDIATNKQDISGLKTKMNTAEGNITDLQGELSTLEGRLNNLNPYIFKGSCKYAELPSSGQTKGDVWNVTDANGYYPAGTNYAWTGTEWDPLGGEVNVEVETMTSAEVTSMLQTLGIVSA